MESHGLIYSRNELIELCNSRPAQRPTTDVCSKIKSFRLARARGCRAGRQKHLRQRRYSLTWSSTNSDVIPVITGNRVVLCSENYDAECFVQPNVCSSLSNVHSVDNAVLPRTNVDASLSHNLRKSRRKHRGRHNIDCLTRQRTIVTISSVHINRNNCNLNYLPTMYLLNACSLAKCNAKQQLATDAGKCDAAIVLVTETHFKVKHNDLVSNIDGFDCFRRDRQKRKGGGVCIYTKHELGAQLVDFNVSQPSVEYIWIKFTCDTNVVYVCCLYHPPKPLYQPCDLLTAICSQIDNILTYDSTAVLVLAGDFNTLDCTVFESDYGLSQIVADNTRQNKKLDKIFVNRPDLIKGSQIIDSLVKSDHKAVVVNSLFPDDCHTSSSNYRYKAVVYDRLPINMTNLVDALSKYSWSGLINAIDSQTIDVDTAFKDFYKVIYWHMWRYIPQRTVIMKPKDPAYITPAIKLLLRKRNRLYRLGHTAAADQLAKKINAMIANNRKQQLCKANRSDNARLWAMLRRSNNWGTKVTRFQNCGDVDDINKYFASVATDDNYSKDTIFGELQRQTDDPSATAVVTANYTSDEIATFLSLIKKTTTGSDELPFWILKDCAFQLDNILAKLINFTINEGVVPSAWKHAVIKPLPKVNPPAVPSDLRPIAITPVLSRFTERLVVRDFLLHYVPYSSMKDQYAYKATGNTTCAIIDITHTVGQLLDTNKYVRCIMLDFTKAFDTVDHFILLQKLEKYHLPCNVLNWLVSFLSGRCQTTNIHGISSIIAHINRSILQGSVVGPHFFLVYIDDLKPCGVSNIIIKFADDSTLLVPETSDVSAEIEMQHIHDWATKNKLSLNLSKTKELVFKRPSIDLEVIPGTINSVERLQCAKVLGVFVDSKLSFVHHVEFLLKVCSQRFYLLQQMRQQGLTDDCLHVIFNSIIYNRILYALSAWGGYLSRDAVNRLDAIFKKATRWKLTENNHSIDQLLKQCDLRLFSRSLNPDHCLHHIFTYNNRSSQLSLRPRGHSFELPRYKYDLARKSFVMRALYNFI